MPSHAHDVLYQGVHNAGVDRKIYGDYGAPDSGDYRNLLFPTTSGTGVLRYSRVGAVSSPMNTDNRGNGNAHNNMQPYETVYRYRRTA